jgi:D-sedoheptulose 7-phosphate isomerase
MKERFIQYLKASDDLIHRVVNDYGIFEKAKSAIMSIEHCLRGGGKVVIAGNGGSAADAQHFAAELISRFSHNRIALPAIALTTDTSIITAVGNDFGFEHIFSRQIEGLARPGDVFLGISTSGNSKNIIQAVIACAKRGITTIGLLGNNGGLAKDYFHIPIIVPSDNTPKIQEMHITLLHFICWELERDLRTQVEK